MAGNRQLVTRIEAGTRRGSLSSFRSLCCICLLAFCSSFAAADGASLPWRSLTFAKSYFWVDAYAKLTLEEVPASGARWPTPALKGVTALPATSSNVLWRLSTTSRIASNGEEVTTLLNPLDTRTYQRSRLSSGKQKRLKTYQYFTSNLLRSRREPAPGEESLDPNKWSRVKPQLLGYRAGMAPGSSVVAVNSLLVALGRAPLSRSGDRWSIQVHTDLDFYNLTFRVAGRERVSVNYRQTLGNSTHQVKATADVLVIALEPVLLGKGPANDPFEFMGLTGPIRICLDAATRLPVQIRGNAPRMGDAAIDLADAVLAAAPETASSRIK